MSIVHEVPFHQIKNILKANIILIISTFLLFTPKRISAQADVVNNPIKNFEQLWKTFDLRYANFELKQVDWNAIYSRYRPSINKKTTNKELFNICCSMLQELNDGHVGIDPNFDELDIDCGAPYDFKLELAFETTTYFRAFEKVIEHELGQNNFSDLIQKPITETTNFQYALSDAFTYLRIDEMTEKFTFGKFKKTLDQLIEASVHKEGFIIDLRFNGGGWDHISYILASRFVPEGSTIGHYERTKIKGKDAFSPMKFKQIKSRGKTQFTKPVVILTSDFTASAAEVFVLLMRELPNVTIIGDRTEGIFSDMYEFKLPNKWEVSLSHQQYFSQKKENFEGNGIPPNIQIINQKKDIERQIDPVLKRAIEHLKQ